MTTNVYYGYEQIASLSDELAMMLTGGSYVQNNILVEDVPDTPNLQTKSVSYTPSESSQSATIEADQNYDGLESVSVSVGAISSSYVGSGITRRDSTDLSASGATVSVPAGYYASAASKAVPSGTEGTPTATKGTVSNHAVSVTPSVTNSAGYIAGGTHSGTAVSVSASELVSGTYTVDSSGTKDVTNYASASVPAGTAGTPSATKGTVSNHSVQVIPSVTNQTGWIAGSTIQGSAVTVQASELVSGSQTIQSNGPVDVTNLAEIVVDVSGGGSTGLQVGTASTTTGAGGQQYIQFSGLLGTPTSFVLTCEENVTVESGFQKFAAVVYDGTNLLGQSITNTSNSQVTFDDSSLTLSFSSGGIQITASGNGGFVEGDWTLVYTYGGGSIETSDVQVGSGATSISFTGLEDEPVVWSCIFKSNFSTSNGYQRVIAVANDGTDTYGMEMDSSAHYSDAHWTASYSNGTLTITSQGTNAGGYFHQPGYYQLTYALDTSGNYQSKTVTPTTSQQVVTADSQYDALKKVTVNAIPSEYIIPTGNIAITSNTGTGQSLDVSQYATATVNVPTGGGGASVDTKTVTASNRPSTISFSSMKGEPIMFALKATFTMTSSSSTYYYVDSMRGYLSNGSYTVQGRLFRMGSTRQTEQVQTGYSATYSGGTLTLTSTGNRTTSPGCYYNGSYELVYVY